MQGKNEVTIESVVYGGVFLSCFQEGKITAWNEMSEHSIMRIHAKVCHNLKSLHKKLSFSLVNVTESTFFGGFVYIC